jgi:hypothetical protein
MGGRRLRRQVAWLEHFTPGGMTFGLWNFVCVAKKIFAATGRRAPDDPTRISGVIQGATA